jgi:multisubunit Na+/H+ antiporter MnhB subunit
MKNPVAFVLLGVGIVLLVMGIDAYGAFDSRISRWLSGRTTDRAMWLLIGGAVSTALGAAMMFQRGRRRG